MRTKACRKLGEAICGRTSQFVINAERSMFIYGRQIWGAMTEDGFARLDGFKNAAEMLDWFEANHGLPFEGTLIEWNNQ